MLRCKYIFLLFLVSKNHLPCRYTESDEFIRELCDKVTH